MFVPVFFSGASAGITVTLRYMSDGVSQCFSKLEIHNNSSNANIFSKHFLDTQRSPLRVLTHLFLVANLGGGHYYYIWFTDKKTEAQTGGATCPKSIRKKQRQDLNPGQLAY